MVDVCIQESRLLQVLKCEYKAHLLKEIQNESGLFSLILTVVFDIIF